MRIGNDRHLGLKMVVVGMFILSTLLQPFSLCASAETDSLMYELHFPINSATVDTLFQRNSEVYRALTRLSENKSAYRIQKVGIRSWASPDGNRMFNLRLAENRANATRRFLFGVLPSAEGKTYIEHGGEAWDLFRSHLTDKDTTLDAESNARALQILNSETKPEAKKQAFRRLPFFGTMAESVLPQLRKSVVWIWVDRTSASPYSTGITGTNALPVPTCSPDASCHLSIPQVNTSTGTERSSRRMCFAIKTNLLYDAALIPNVGVELPIGKHWSVSADWMYAWWKTDRKHDYWRIYGGDAEVRYWFAPDEGKPLSRHHVGVYAQMLTYDFELGHRGYLADKWSWATGASYGYSLPIAHRLHLDFVIGVGYMGGTFKEYIPDDGCYVWQSTKRRHYIGPTKAEVSLVYLLGRSYAHRKGGAR